MIDEHAWFYVARAKIRGRNVVVQDRSFDGLKGKMAEVSREEMHHQVGVNSHQSDTEPYREPYCEDLTFPEIRWTVKRREIDG